MFAFVEPAIDQSFSTMRSLTLDDQTWVDHQGGWLLGDQVLFDRLVHELGWGQRRGVVMEPQRLLPEPRLTFRWTSDEGPEPLPMLATMRRALSLRYGEAFDSIGFNCYRRGSDSLGWHSDSCGEAMANPVVAIVSLGAPRRFLLRPSGGGPSRPFDLGNGDLLVMGGACQHRWEHCVPKVRRAEPRISITYRPSRR